MPPGEAYKALVQFTTSAESTRWNRFYNYLTANSLLIVAWATLYSKADMPRVVAMAICLIGMLGGIAWAFLGYRSTRFHNGYMQLGSHMERNWPGGSTAMPFTMSLEARDAPSIHRYLGSSYYVLTMGPITLLCLYVLLLEQTLPAPTWLLVVTAVLLFAGWHAAACYLDVLARRLGKCEKPRAEQCPTCQATIFPEACACGRIKHFAHAGSTDPEPSGNDDAQD